MQRLRADYAALKDGPWQGYAGYDAWFARANNASFGVLAAYNELVPQFERLFERRAATSTRFYAEVRRLAALPKDERRATLRAPDQILAGDPRCPTSASTANTHSAWPRRARSPGSGPKRWSRSSTWSAA